MIAELTRTVYFNVLPALGNKRVGPTFRDAKTARSWHKFVQSSWHTKVETVPCKLRWVDGRLDAISIAQLDKFAVDADSKTPGVSP